MMAAANPPRNGEGDRAAQQRGGGGVPSLRRPETYRARKLRGEMSLPEVLLWQRLRGSALGVKFRRQHPVGPYIADFYCSALRLVIEIDGQIHEQSEQLQRDANKNRFMAENGYQVIRIIAADVLKYVDMVADGIARYIASPLHHPADGPPPRAGEDLA
jgi:very-short-patch-repair endonuclease